ncbi:ATP-dependent translocase ABCB1-like isoform X2 [Aethina tumida]|uniref:ATP-dependent translocase ABCB1-like isoform X2 n=1 Tax=Aethina tumida TaxID=116153 RepID=UPI00214765ED|nr:ATP-dependent translocase ABCB1-like isoform X2 [Aethina tumida]
MNEANDLKPPKDNEKEKEVSLPYYRLFRYSSGLDKVCMAFGVVCSVICGAGQPYMLLLFGDVTGAIVEYAVHLNNETLNDTQWDRLNDKLYSEVERFSIYTCIIGFLTILTTYLAGISFTYSATRQIFRIRKLFLEKTLNQDIGWYDLHQTGDFATTFTDNLTKIEDGIGEKIGIFLFFESTFVAGIIMALIKGWKLALVCLVSLPLSTISMGLITWLSTKFSKQEMESYASAGAVAEEVLTSIRTVVAFDGQDKEIDRYNEHLLTAKKNNIKKSFFNSISNGVMWFFTFANFALSFWYGVTLIIAEADLPPEDVIYTPGNMISVFFATLSASWNFGMGTPFLDTFGTAKGAAYKVFSILDSQPKINKSKESGKTLSKCSGDITFDNVHFNYPSRSDVKILQGFNLKIKHGETVALVGSSGCGKSTCVQLIQRFYDPDSGNILLDNHNIKDLNLIWLRNKIGVVGQEPALFATSIAENIRYGKLDATQAEIEKAAMKANAHKFIQNLPHGYQTVIGERGAQLSGGQKQRIAIARALIKNPDILLLDEATSALDTTSEAEVQASLDSISGDCTTIIVAHRLSTIRKANRIVFVSQGKVIEEGTHGELMELKGEYFKLVNSQGHDDNELKEEHFLQRTISISNKSLTSQNDELVDELMVTEVDQPNKGSLLKIMKMNSPEWLIILVGCLASIISGASLPVYALVFGDIVGVLSNQDKDQVQADSNKYSLYFLIIGIVTGLATFFQMFSFGVAGEKLTKRIRLKTFEAMLHQEMGWYDKKENGVGALCAQLAGDAASVQGAAGIRIGSVLNSMSTFILSCTFALFYDWKLALVLLSFAPLILMSIWFEQKTLQGDASQKMLENSSKVAVEAIGNIRTVVSLGCEKVFYNIYVKELHPYQVKSKRKSHFRGLVLGLARSLMLFAYAAGITYGAQLIVRREQEYGTVFKVAEAVITGSWSIGNALSFSPNFQQGLNAAGRIFSLLERIPLIRNMNLASSKIWEKTNIDYFQIYFSYPTRPTVSVLNGLDLSILEGKTVALVGSSGCGKSTIIQLLERFYDPTYGEITVDGDDTRMLDLKTLRSQIGIVSQEPNLFDRTIEENIAYGANDRKVPKEEIESAAKSANIHNFITSLPLNYETRLGSKGAQLSGGQKQRVAIARALVRNPKILLLDEATSALDNESEKIVQEALDNAKQGRTCITIAHRLTTIKDADLIIVLNEGRIGEMGTHQELLARKDLYYKFYKLQSGAH